MHIFCAASFASHARIRYYYLRVVQHSIDWLLVGTGGGLWHWPSYFCMRMCVYAQPGVFGFYLKCACCSGSCRCVWHTNLFLIETVMPVSFMVIRLVYECVVQFLSVSNVFSLRSFWCIGTSFCERAVASRLPCLSAALPKSRGRRKRNESRHHWQRTWCLQRSAGSST